MDGYIYLVQEREFIRLKEDTFKIGKTRQEDFKRFKQYPNGSILKAHIASSNCDRDEKILLKLFKEKYIHKLEYGREYFSGPYYDMITDITRVVSSGSKNDIMVPLNEDIFEEVSDLTLDRKEYIFKPLPQRLWVDTPCWKNKKLLTEELKDNTSKMGHLEDLHSNFLVCNTPKPLMIFYKTDPSHPDSLILRFDKKSYITKIMDDYYVSMSVTKYNGSVVHKKRNILNFNSIREVTSVTWDRSLDTFFVDPDTLNTHVNLHIKHSHTLDDIKKYDFDLSIKKECHDWLYGYLYEVVCSKNNDLFIWYKNFFGNVLFNEAFKASIWPIWIGCDELKPKDVISKICGECIGQSFILTDEAKPEHLIGRSFCAFHNMKMRKVLSFRSKINYLNPFINDLDIPNLLNGIVVSNFDLAEYKEKPFLKSSLSFDHLKNKLSSSSGRDKYFSVLNKPWQYFASYFADYDDKYSFDESLLDILASNRHLTPFESFIKDVIYAKYESLPKPFPTTDMLDMYKSYAFPGNKNINIKQSDFNNDVQTYKICLGEPTRLTTKINGITKRSMCFILNTKENIRDYWTSKTNITLN